MQFVKKTDSVLATNSRNNKYNSPILLIYKDLCILCRDFYECKFYFTYIYITQWLLLIHLVDIKQIIIYSIEENYVKKTDTA